MNYLILGANAAGLSAAVRIKKFDKSAAVTVLEKSDVVSFGACGIPFYVGGEFADIEQMTARPFADFAKSGIDIRLFHNVTAVNPGRRQVTATDGKSGEDLTFSYDKLLIATGASPARPPVAGLDGDQINTMHSKYDAITIVEKLPHIRNIAIIGAGFIGVETAEAMREKGKQLRLFEVAPRVLERTFDEEITALLEGSLRDHGVSLHLGEHVKAVETTRTGSRIVTGEAAHDADLVILAAGFSPNTAFLNGSGIACDRRGAILIDDQCRTNIDSVFAAGDCAVVRHRIGGDTYLPLATTANKLGRLAGDVMAGRDNRFIGTLGSCGIRVFGLEAGRTGISESEAAGLGIDYSTVFIKDKNRTDYVAGQTDIWVKLIYDRGSRKLLGGQICGSYGGGAVHRVDALAVAVYSGLTVDELGYMDFVYAPPFARTWDVLNVAGNVAK